jgi:hypothetical protein
MRIIEADGKTAGRRGYATNSTLAGINLIVPKRPGRRTTRAKASEAQSRTSEAEV